MSKRPATILLELELRLIDSDAKDGKYQIVADGAVFALARFAGGEWTYPGGDLLEFGPSHYRPASAAMKPEASDG